MTISEYSTDLNKLLNIENTDESVAEIKKYFLNINEDENSLCQDLLKIEEILKSKDNEVITPFQCHKRIDEIINPY